MCNERSLRSIQQELEKFKSQSGFTVSYGKTTIYRIGSLRHSCAQMYNFDTFAWSNQDITVLGVTIAHEDLVGKNYGGMIEKAKNTLFSWNNRGLSLIGKVQVVNTLIASLFVYKMMVLPIIPKGIVKSLENVVREFLWDGKTAKIAYDILQNPKSQGGVNLVNFLNKDKALKATWPQILSKEKEYATFVYSILRCSIYGDNIWRTRLHPTDVDKLGIKSEFWTDVLKSWSEYNYYTDFRIENQLLWFNSDIKVKGKPILWGHIYRKGLLYVSQLFKEGTYKSEEEVQQEFGLSVMRFNSLKVAIPKEWKEFFCQNSPAQFHPRCPHTFDRITVIHTKGFSGKVYKLLGNDAMLIHGKFLKWRQEIGEELCPTLTEFADLHRDIYRVTNVAKYRSFQYRLLQRGLVTNIHLKNWNITQSDLCYYCGQEQESLAHLFWECPKIRRVWEDLEVYLRAKFPTISLNFSLGEVLFNQVHQRKSHVVNFICLLTKQTIYAQKWLGLNIDCEIVKRKVHLIERIEKFIAVKNGRYDQHCKKWVVIRAERDKDLQSYINEYTENNQIV